MDSHGIKSLDTHAYEAGGGGRGPSKVQYWYSEMMHALGICSFVPPEYRRYLYSKYCSRYRGFTRTYFRRLDFEREFSCQCECESNPMYVL